MIALIATFLARNWLAQVAAALLIGWLALKGWGTVKYALGWTHGRAQLAEDLNRQAGKEAEEIAKAQEPAEAPGAAERLRKTWCEDCK